MGVASKIFSLKAIFEPLMNMRFLLLPFFLLITSTSLLSEVKPFAPSIYPFQNGVNFKTLEEGVRIVKELGYHGIGSVYPNRLAEFKAACDTEKLKIYSIYVDSRVNEDGFSYDQQIDKVFAVLKGSDALVELNVQRGKNPTDEQAIALVGEVADKAKEAGLKVVLYPHSNFFIERVDHAVRIAKAANRDNLGIAFNLCHFLKVQPTDDLSATLTEAKPFLWSVSINGADTEGKDWNTLIRPLDEGTFDQATLIEILRKIGYKGAVGLQCFNIKIDSRQHLTRSIKAWKKFLVATEDQPIQ